MTNEEESAVKKGKVIMLEGKFTLYMNGVIEQRADLGSVGKAIILETVYAARETE